MKKLITICAVAMMILAVSGVAQAETFELDGNTFQNAYGPAHGYVAYIQPYDSANALQKPDQAIEQYGSVGNLLGTHVEGTQFATPSGQPFGAGEAVSWAGRNYVVTYWWDTPGYAPCNGTGGDIYIHQPDDGVRSMGILYNGQWKMFDAGTNGLSAVAGASYSWDLGAAGVAEGDTIEALAYWGNALGFPGLDSESWDGTSRDPNTNAKIKIPIVGPTALDMDGDTVVETLTFMGGGNPLGYHDPFYMGVQNAVPEPATMSLLALGGLAVLKRRRRRSA